MKQPAVRGGGPFPGDGRISINGAGNALNLVRELP